ncbi:MAG: hypothetical protein AAF799_27630 [Myxococcota bacterium]
MSDEELEAYLAIERGEPVPPGSEGWAERHAEVVGLLEGLDRAPAEDDDGWKDEVLERALATAQPEPSRFNGVAIGIVVAAAAALVLVLSSPAPPVDPGSSHGSGLLRVSIEGPDGVRGHAAVGSTITLDVPAQGGAELRIYRNGRELLARCTSATCETGPQGLRLSFVVPQPGRYQPVILRAVSGAPLPASGTLGADLRQAREAGATVRLGETVRVF